MKHGICICLNARFKVPLRLADHNTAQQSQRDQVRYGHQAVEQVGDLPHEPYAKR